MTSVSIRIITILLYMVAFAPFHISSQQEFKIDENFDHLFVMPILLLQENGRNSTAHFQFNFRDMELNKTITTLCQKYIIPFEMCRSLYEMATKERYNILEKKMLEYQLQHNNSSAHFQLFPNSHLQRRTVAITSAIDNLIKSTNFTLKMEVSMNRAFQSVHRALKPVLSRNRVPSSIPTSPNHSYPFDERKRKPNLHELQLVVIHSCSFQGEESRVLASLLSSIVTSGLIDRRVQVIVLNYGEMWNQEILQPYSTHARIHFIHVSNHISLFELPTLIILHKLSKMIVTDYALPLSQILYLHTKGVSYTQMHPQIEDWRELMLHFLVEKHTMCHHLLASGAIDVVGVNFRTIPRAFPGNFWWTTAQYLSSLAPLSLVQHHRYDAETWLLTASTAVRVFNAHESTVDHHRVRYERFRYAPTTVNLTTQRRKKSYSVDDKSSLTTTPPMRWLDMNMMPAEQQRTSYCRTKQVSWSQLDNMLSAIVAQT